MHHSIQDSVCCQGWWVVAIETTLLPSLPDTILSFLTLPFPSPFPPGLVPAPFSYSGGERLEGLEKLDQSRTMASLVLET